MRQLLSLLFTATPFFSAIAQLPETDVWLFKITKDKTQKQIVTEGHNITDRKGYDNQPSFSRDGKMIYYVSVREDQQADIYTYQLKSKKSERFTSTIESEYSPVQSEDGMFVTSVVVEKDSAQRIHYYKVSDGLPQRKFEFDSVGYYEFLNPDTVLYYKLTQPHSLRFYVNSTKEDKFLANSPVRAFKKTDRHSIVFGIKDSSGVSLYKYDFFVRKAVLYCRVPSLQEDFIWHPAHGLMRSEGPTIQRYLESDKKWVTSFDLTPFGVKKITRFVFDPKNQILVVVDNK